jgi:dihydrofolate reductase
MRRIIAGMFITLDGVIEAPEQWNPPYYNEEMTEAVQGQITECDTHLYGRRTYQLFQSVFTRPGSEGIPHAKLMTDTTKVVVSTTLTEAAWGPTTLISSDAATQLAKLKQQPGKDISVGGSGTLVRFLLQEGLLDSWASWYIRSSSAAEGACSKAANLQRASDWSTARSSRLA